MLQDPIDDKSTLIQVMVLCSQETTHNFVAMLTQIIIAICYHKLTISYTVPGAIAAARIYDLPQQLSYTYIQQWNHYGDVTMGAIASQITNLTIIYSTVFNQTHIKENNNYLRQHRYKIMGCFLTAQNHYRNSPRTGEFPAHMASNAENASIWWRHHVFLGMRGFLLHAS